MASAAKSSQANERAISNPLIERGADPSIRRHCAEFGFTATAGNRVDIRHSPTLAGLATARPVTVWRAPATGPFSRDILAPEFHIHE